MANPDETNDPAAPFRAAAEKSVEQARKAFEDMMGMAQKTVSGLETNSSQLQGKVRDLTRETLDFAGASAEATFALVDRLSKAKSPEEAVAIQKAFVEAQMERLGRQARSFGDTTIKAAQDLTKPFER
jgi:phasin